MQQQGKVDGEILRVFYPMKFGTGTVALALWNGGKRCVSAFTGTLVISVLSPLYVLVLDALYPTVPLFPELVQFIHTHHVKPNKSRS